MLDADGRPTGELQEMAAMHGAFQALDFNIFDLVASVETLERYGRIARRAGVTTITDLFNPLTDAGVAALEAATAPPDYPVRLVPAMSAMAWSAEEGVGRLLECRARGNERLHFGPVKIMTDGSIQGFTARLKWPGYFNGSPNGIWNAPPDSLRETLHAYHQAGVQAHVHTNGDEAVELILDAAEEALGFGRVPNTATPCSTARSSTTPSFAARRGWAYAATCSPTTSTTGATST